MESNTKQKLSIVAPDTFLEELLCSQCKKYLSVPPIKIWPNRSIKCGRLSCFTFNDEMSAKSQFNILSPNMLYRCINRFEGCNQLLRDSEVYEHEMNCEGATYQCPNCIEPYRDTAYLIYVHFKEKHTNLLITSPMIILNLNSELHNNTFLYRQNDSLFYISLMNDDGFEKELQVSILYLGTDQNAAQISLKYTLLSDDDLVLYKQKEQPCYSVTQSNCDKIKLDSHNLKGEVIVCKWILNINRLNQVLWTSNPGNTKYPITSLSNSFNHRRSLPPVSKAPNKQKIAGLSSVKTFPKLSDKQLIDLSLSLSTLKKSSDKSFRFPQNLVWPVFPFQFPHLQEIKKNTRAPLFFETLASEGDKCYRWQSITESIYSTQSFEELRWICYQNNGKPIQVNNRVCSAFPSHLPLTQLNKNTSIAPVFFPSRGNEEDTGSSFQSITAILAYSSESFEELRWEYYQNNWKSI